MENIQYIMVTNWQLHWDELGKWNYSTLFTIPMIKDGLSKVKHPAEAKTLFIKLNKENIFEKSWVGVSKNFRTDRYSGKPCIRFDVEGLQEIECPEEFKYKSSGWYLNSSEINYLKTNTDAVNNPLQPPFFAEMVTCDWATFEKYCYYLLRLLGIHNIHTFPQTDNRGKADGFFKFQSLTVIYDATLETNFFEQKEQQIENYINQLKKEKISFATDSYTIKDTQRQVWIITRGKEVRHLKTEDHIKVKEIPYTRLIQEYNQRLEKEIGLDELWDNLKDLK